MKIINEAFEVLSDPHRRAEHDSWIEQQELSEARKQNAEKSNTSEPSTDQSYSSVGQADSDTYNEKEFNKAKFRSTFYHDAESRFNFYSELKQKYFNKENQQCRNDGLDNKEKVGFIGKQPQYKFYQVIGSGYVSALIACQAFSGKSLGQEAMTLLQLFSKPTYLASYLSYYFAYATGTFAFPFLAACIGWIFGNLIPQTRHNPSLLAAALMIIAGSITAVAFLLGHR
jgi:curved DNA-binding protein CbpA